MYGYGFLSRGFTDRREILHGGSATSQTGFLPLWGIALGDGRVLGASRGHGGICFLLKHLRFTYFYLNIKAKGTSHLHADKKNVNAIKQYNETYNRNVKLQLRDQNYTDSTQL